MPDNHSRAARAKAALDTYQGSDADNDEVYQDLINDILHLVHNEGDQNAAVVLSRAIAMYVYELEEDNGTVEAGLAELSHLLKLIHL